MQGLSSRESWLQAASAYLFDHMEQQGLPCLPVRVSCGWPSRGGVGNKKIVIGQCFAPVVCKDGTPQIFISPRLDESIEVLGTLLHELIHASVGCEHGHRAPFSQAARKCGLSGPPTATEVSETLRPLLQAFVDTTGLYPHAAILPVVKKRAGSRLRLYQCSCEKPVKVRVANDAFDARCLSCGERFLFIEKEQEEQPE